MTVSDGLMPAGAAAGIVQLLDAANARARAVRRAVEQGGGTIPADHALPADLPGLRDAYDHVSRMVWGAPLTWLQVDGSWVFVSPPAPPAPPPTCGTCGHPVSPTSPALRWGGLGRGDGRNGWLHECDGDLLAGHSPMEPR